MKYNFDDFNNKVEKSMRKTKRLMFGLIIFRIVIIGLFIFGAVKFIQYMNNNDTSLVKEFGKTFENIKGEFNDGRHEVASDTLVIDTLKVQ